jgi:hypothetical protein
MYTPIPPQPTNAQAWLAAASAVQDAGGESYNVVIDVADPLAVSGPDEAILTIVDQFLCDHHVNSLSGVANTIFPQGLLNRHGANGIYTAYNKLLKSDEFSFVFLRRLRFGDGRRPIAL